MTNSDLEHLKLCNARRIRDEKLQNTLLPSVIEQQEKYPRRKIEQRTWSDWFFERFGETYQDYVTSLKYKTEKSK